MSTRRHRAQHKARPLIHISPFGWIVIFVIAMVIISRFPGGQ
jgi:hypothetical protein